MRPQYTFADPAPFLSHLDRSSETDGCWPWLLGRDKRGYGDITFQGKTDRAHRIAWRYAAGDIPVGFTVCHTCDNPSCCRNDDIGWYEIGGILRPRRGHLWLGTQTENMQDAARKRHLTPQAHPERMQRGAQHWSHRIPERVVRGTASWPTRHPERFSRGEQRPGNKLTTSQVREILALRGIVAQRTIAAQFGVSRAAIQAILEGRTWQHLNES